MAYLGNGPSNTVLVGGSQNIFTPNPSMSGTFTSTGLTNNGFLVVNNTATTTSPYVVVSTDYIVSMNASGGAKIVHLPNAPTSGRVFVVKDVSGIAATNNITITTVGGVVTIDGATSYVMNVNYQSLMLVFNGTSYFVI